MIPDVNQEPDMRVAIQFIAAEDVDLYWSEISTLLFRIPGIGDRYSVADVRRWLEEKEMQAWRIADRESDETLAVFMTEAHEWPAKKVLAIPFVAGEGMEKWLGFLPAFERFAKDEGFSEIELCGRPGWGKVTGYEERYRVFTKDLSDV